MEQRICVFNSVYCSRCTRWCGFFVFLYSNQVLTSNSLFHPLFQSPAPPLLSSLLLFLSSFSNFQRCLSFISHHPLWHLTSRCFSHHLPCCSLCPSFWCFLSVWPRPVHSEHQIRFAGRRHTPPHAAEQRASHLNHLPWKRGVSTRPSLPRFGRPLHIAPARPAHPTDVHPQPQLPRGPRHAAHPRTQPHTKPQPPTPGTGGSPPLPHPRGSALTPRYASVQQPHGPQPRHAGQFLQPRQPRLTTWRLSQRTGEAQLCLTLGFIHFSFWRLLVLPFYQPSPPLELQLQNWGGNKRTSWSQPLLPTLFTGTEAVLDM